MKTRILSILLVMMICLTSSDITVFAQSMQEKMGSSVEVNEEAGETAVSVVEPMETVVGGFVISGGKLNSDYCYTDGILTISTNTPITIRNEDINVATNDTIFIENGVSAHITLAGINIDVSDTGEKGGVSGKAALEIAANSAGDVTVFLAKGTSNTLRSGYYRAGLEKNAGDGILTIDGEGTLVVSGGTHGAGIGGGSGSNGSHIVIKDGVIETTSGSSGAGIGGGLNGHGTDIVIDGGRITATSGAQGAGIGGGSNGHGTDIVINGGIINASSRINGGAGIGGGNLGIGSNITITGGRITATGATNGAGIGGGSGGDYLSQEGNAGNGYDITITGGMITAIGDGNGTGIGGGRYADGYNIYIKGNSVVKAACVSTGTKAHGRAIGDGGSDFSWNSGKDYIRDDWNGLIIKGNYGKIYGNNVKPNMSISIQSGDVLEIEEDKILEIPQGVVLTIEEGAVVKNNGTIRIYDSSCIMGEIEGNQPVIYRGNDVEIETADKIAVFSTEKSLTVETGDTMWLGFGKIVDEQLADDWSKMAIVVSDPTIISFSEYVETEYGYSLEVTGKKQGATNVTVTDTESGVSTIFVVTVRDSYVETYSYAIDRMETFFPNNKWEGDIETNIYNLNGLYVNNYSEYEMANGYKVTFDVYNSEYHTGAVDIYDADGNWIDCEEIKKYGMISSLWDTGEQVYYLISDWKNDKLLTYEQASFAEHTQISIEIPDGGYFTISNNFAESPGVYLFNSCEIIFNGACTLIDAVIDVKNNKVYLSEFSKLIKNEIVKDETTREKFIDIFKKTAKKEVKKCLKNFAINEIDDRYADFSGLFENLLNSLDISWKHLFKSVTGVTETALIKDMGPAGIALKGCFAMDKEGNQLLQAVDIATSIDAPYVTVYSSISEGEINPHGVIVNTNGNMDAEAVLQVFRVSNNNTIEVVLNGDPLQKYELYNICFVKDDQLVQPSGKVTVRIPIPNGMKKDTCNVYRQEEDGSWTILTAHVEGNYLVFETDHFSFYGVVGEEDTLSILSLPNKTQYNVGETLNSAGLVLSLAGEQITRGFVCEPTVLSKEGEQEITVQYGIASAKFSVSVQRASESGGSDDEFKGDIPSTPSETKKWPFTDVANKPGNWKYEAVKYVYDNKIMNGVGDGTRFDPDAPLTREMFATVLYRMAGEPAVTFKNKFPDVPAGKWYSKAVIWASEQGIVSGYGRGNFGTGHYITREQIAKMLMEYGKKQGYDVSQRANFSTFADAGKVSGWATDYMKWAVGSGMIGGSQKDGKYYLNPRGNATRAESATMLKRFMEKY